MNFHFLELKDDEIDVHWYKCESLISSDESLHESYKIGIEMIEEFIRSKAKKLEIYVEQYSNWRG